MVAMSFDDDMNVQDRKTVALDLGKRTRVRCKNYSVVS